VTPVDLLDLGAGRALAVVADDRGGLRAVPVVSDGVSSRRAAPGDGVAEGLLTLLAGGDRVEGRYRVRRWRGSEAAGERGVGVDQTNESVIVGDAAVVKWVTQVSDGPHPAPSLLEQLERAGFTGMPKPWGVVEWSPSAEAEPLLLAIVAEYFDDAVDGWTWAVEDIRAGSTGGGEAVGDLVAAFHRALAPTARPASADEVAAWRAGAVADLERAIQVTDGTAHGRLVRHAHAVRAAIAEIPDGGSVLRVHGDLHVGQVLRARGAAPYDYRLTDFDGNPVVPAAERIREQPAALDVAGMSQSFVHAGIVTRKHNPDLDPARVTAAAAAARVAFLDAYRLGLGDAAPLLDERLLRPLALRQICREFTYAATHLPRWSYVPEAALTMALEES
jgi:maltokinase